MSLKTHSQNSKDMKEEKIDKRRKKNDSPQTIECIMYPNTLIL